MAKHSLTKEQFTNLLRLALIFKQEVVTSSPDYLIEKFTRLIGNPELINDVDEQGALHAILEGTINTYLDYWKPEFLPSKTYNNEYQDQI